MNYKQEEEASKFSTNREDTTDNGAYVGNEVWEGFGVFSNENLQPKKKDQQCKLNVEQAEKRMLKSTCIGEISKWNLATGK